MDLQLAGKRAIVTGASRGIGYAVARALAAEGAAVVLAARGQDALDAAAARIAADGGRALAVVTDTTDEASVRGLVRRAAGEFGGVDILVNSAATPATSGFSSALADVDDDRLRHEVETKVLGYLRCARAVAPLMAAQGWGRVINVSGLAARQTGSVIGSIRNVAVAAMTKNLGDELGPQGINVTVVHPGATITEASPATFAAMAEAQGVEEAEIVRRFASGISIGRLVTAEEIAHTVVFLASPLSVAINGEAIAVGGGQIGPIHY
ncbi:short-chain dehydrogenase [Streptomyces sp. 150FB]|uniref:SDR family NAD(P)-dependent oxidoreductase n=1 Tax=Streptomyces sp. 150FB TaxID=1576605 RepID=UPI00058923A3|nr:SDR family oxidoreductase [Streptomyces sp. 150FB]KIF74941.1 short-chain dehydrogenase [Streptomyces sp. 150FB]